MKAFAITGAQLNAMSDDEFDVKLKNIIVYARVQPDHKTRIVNAWRKAGYVTAMTGDGVNDAPPSRARTSVWVWVLRARTLPRTLLIWC